MELDATVRPIQISAKDAKTIAATARTLERKNFKRAAEVIDEIVAQYDGAEHLAVIDRRTLLAVESRDASPRRRLRRSS